MEARSSGGGGDCWVVLKKGQTKAILKGWVTSFSLATTNCLETYTYRAADKEPFKMD